MTAEEYFDEWLKTQKKLFANPIDFAEYYHKAKVEAINQAKIDEACDEQCPWENGQEGTYEEGKNVGFDFGANWVIKQLLEQ